MGKFAKLCDADKDAQVDPNRENTWLLCYEKCKPGYQGVGPFCFLQNTTLPLDNSTAVVSTPSDHNMNNQSGKTSMMPMTP